MSWTIIYHHYQKESTHLDKIIHSNPKSQIIDIHTEHNYDKDIAWSNNDRILRENLKKQIDNIIHEKVLLVEWDVLINMEVPDIKFDGLVAQNIFRKGDNIKWYWWKELEKLPEYYKPFICGASLWSLIGITKECLVEILNSKYDDLYNMDIFCEIRTSTILRSLGFNMTKFPTELSRFILRNESSALESMENIKYYGIFHPVKNSVPPKSLF